MGRASFRGSTALVFVFFRFRDVRALATALDAEDVAWLRAAAGVRAHLASPCCDFAARVARRYALRGYRILARNVWAGGNELDLIARRGGRLLFVEVKGKTGARYGDPLEMVGPEKRRRIERAAEAWLAANPAFRPLEPTFEVAAVRAGRIERVPLAF